MPPVGSAPTGFFAPTSIWNAPVPANAPLDPNSGAVVNSLLAQITPTNLGIGTTNGGVPIYTVGPDQPGVHVTLNQGPGQTNLHRAFDAVPIPAGAQPDPGSDENLAVYRPSTNEMWEFWKLTHTSTGWSADWGGRMANVSGNPGYYQNMVSPQGRVLERWNWGTTAASFPLVAGVMRISELEAGVIPHALALAITHTCANVWASPAQRTDGDSTEAHCVPEGAHLRLDPSLNLALLHLPHFTMMMAKAAQRYGIIINNSSEGFTFRAENPTQYIQQYGYNPYLGSQNQPGRPRALLDEWPSELLRSFPWSHLQLLQMSLRDQPNTSTVTCYACG